MQITLQQYQRALRPRRKLSTLIVAALLGVSIGAAATVVAPAHAAPPTVSGTCKLVVPPNPTTAVGLATPWQIGGGCTESNANLRVFVQAAILSADGTSVSVYDPLVIDSTTTPAVVPTPPTITSGSTVGIWVGGNDVKTDLVGAGAGQCVNGTGGPGVGATSQFGQVAFCNASAYFTAANAAITGGKLVVPPLGTSSTGAPCPTVRSFQIVDQDPSDNVQTVYLLTASGQTMQNTAANRTAFPAAVQIKNPSDNRLLTSFVDPAIGCTPWKVPDVTDSGEVTSAQPLDELQAAAYQATPLGLVPLGDEMTEINMTTENVAKTNAYRAGVDQPAISTAAPGDDTYYCKNLLAVAPPFFKAHMTEMAAKASPLPDVANNLWTFVAQRFVGTYETLFHSNCVTIAGADPVTVTYTNGVATGAAVS